MTDPKPDVYRVMAEQLWEAIPAYDDPLHKEEEINDFEKAIRSHTIVPEMVEGFQLISAKHGTLPLDNIEEVNGINEGRDRGIKLRACVEIARNILAKAQGRK